MTNTKQNVASIVADILLSTEQDGTRQAQLILAYHGEAIKRTRPEAMAAIVSILHLDGAAKTEKLDERLGQLAPAYKSLRAQIEQVSTALQVTGEHALVGTKKREQQVLKDNLNTKSKAARAMFERTLNACYYLLTIEIEKKANAVRLNNGLSGGAIIVREVNTHGEGESVLYTCSLLTSKGAARYASDTGKVRDESKKVRKPGEIGLQDSAKALGANLRRDTSGKLQPIEDYTDDTSDVIESTFATLFTAKFWDYETASFDTDAINDYVKTLAATMKPKAAKAA